VVIKDERPWSRGLAPGQFVSFRSANW
jgi:hypothetical protein